MTFLDLPTRGIDPIALFHQWLEEAKSSEINDPDAACLATCADSQPSARMVLIRQVDERGFTFFTNANSHKGEDLAANAHAALCYHWKSLRRQVRVEGHVENVTEKESDDYFNARPRVSRIGAWASAQSTPLQSRQDLLDKVQELENAYEGQDIPRPPHWHGYRIVPKLIEFWQDGEFRLHDRFVFTQNNDLWQAQRLNP